SGAPGGIGQFRQMRQHVPAHPGSCLAGVEFGGDRVVLAAVVAHDADRDEVDRASVLDELAVVEVASLRSGRRHWSDAAITSTRPSTGTRAGQFGYRRGRAPAGGQFGLAL